MHTPARQHQRTTLARRHGGPLQVCIDAVMDQLDRDCSGPSRVYSASLRSVRRERWVWPTCVMPRLFGKIRPKRQALDGKTASDGKFGGSLTEKGSDADDERK